MATGLRMTDCSGVEVGTVDVDDGWLERTKGTQAVHDAVVAFLAKLRAGTASTKTRGKVRGGGAKPYRQKGTGRARAGSSRSPIWRGGGVIFGPSPRSFAKNINAKVRRLALRRAFTERLDEGAVILVDGIKLTAPKTREMVAFLESVGAGDDALVLVPEIPTDVQLAARNLPGVEVMPVGAVNAYWMLLFDKIVITQAALEQLGSCLGAQEKAK